MSSNNIERQVRHLVGIATLRRLRRMVDSETAVEAVAATHAKRLTLLMAAGAVIFVAGLALMIMLAH